VTLWWTCPHGSKIITSDPLWKGVLLTRSLPISFTGFTLCNSNSQMHRLALSHPWVMGVKAAAKKRKYSIIWSMSSLIYAGSIPLTQNRPYLHCCLLFWVKNILGFLFLLLHHFLLVTSGILLWMISHSGVSLTWGTPKTIGFKTDMV